MRITFSNWDGTIILSVDVPTEMWEGFDSGKYNEIIFPTDDSALTVMATLTRVS
jgi:hypothetical protein